VRELWRCTSANYRSRHYNKLNLIAWRLQLSQIVTWNLKKR
jgi:hypothetical protein